LFQEKVVKIVYGKYSLALGPCISHLLFTDAWIAKLMATLLVKNRDIVF